MKKKDHPADRWHPYRGCTVQDPALPQSDCHPALRSDCDNHSVWTAEYQKSDYWSSHRPDCHKPSGHPSHSQQQYFCRLYLKASSEAVKAEAAHWSSHWSDSCGTAELLLRLSHHTVQAPTGWSQKERYYPHLLSFRHNTHCLGNSARPYRAPFHLRHHNTADNRQQ